MMRTIVLHGAIGEEFGRSFRLDVHSPREAVHALILQLRGFRDALRRGHYRVTRYRRGRPFDFGEEMLRLRAYEKLQNLVQQGIVTKTAKEYQGVAPALKRFLAAAAEQNAKIASGSHFGICSKVKLSP